VNGVIRVTVHVLENDHLLFPGESHATPQTGSDDDDDVVIFLPRLDEKNCACEPHNRVNRSRAEQVGKNQQQTRRKKKTRSVVAHVS